MSVTLDKAGSWRPLALAALLGFAFCAACYYPGAMSLDSAVIWSQARGAPSTNVYGSGLRWLWWLADKFWSGPGSLFLFQLALVWSGLVLIARTLECGMAGRIAFLFAAAFAPVIFVLIAHVWTDVMLLTMLAFTVGALLRWRDTGKVGWYVVFWLALIFSATLRHNAPPAVLPLAAYAVWLRPQSRVAPAMRKRVATIITVVALALGLQSVSELSAWSAQRYFTLWSNPAMWDLAAISVDTNRMLFPPATRKPELTIDDLRAAYVPYVGVPIYTETHGRVIGPYFLPQDPVVAELRRAWLSAMVEHPVAYATHRWRATRALFGSKPRDWPHELVYVDDEFQFRDNPPVVANRSALHGAAIRFAETLRDTAALAPWPYLVLGLASFVLAWRRRTRTNAQAALAVLASGLAYAAPLPLIAPGGELRYVGWTCLAAIIGAALALASGSQRAAGPVGRADKLDNPSEQERPMPASKQTFFLVVSDLAKARGQVPSLSYSGNSAEGFAAELQAALREPGLWERWRSLQPDPDAVDPLLGASDAQAIVDAHQSDLHCDVKITTVLPHAVLKHRLGLLIGAHWTLRDVSAA